MRFSKKVSIQRIKIPKIIRLTKPVNIANINAMKNKAEVYSLCNAEYSILNIGIL